MFLIPVVVFTAIIIHACILRANRGAGTYEENKFLKPDVTAFLIFGFLRSFLVSAVILNVVYFGYNVLIGFIAKTAQSAGYLAIPSGYLWIAMAAIAAPTWFSLNIRYKKEEYYFHSDRLVQKGGGVFSDFERELNVKNITHVTMLLPYIENNLFGTGTIRIESAGALTSEIVLRDVAEPKGLYDIVTKLMISNGFRLRRDNLVEQERPHGLAVFFEVFGIFSATIFFGTAIITDILDSQKIGMGTLFSQYGLPVFCGLGLFMGGLLGFCLFRFLDLKRRVYDLYEDTIAYSEGFLNKNYSFIPIENLADSTVTQSLFSRIFGLYDVKISCQGSGQEVLFKNMANGEKLSKNIDALISKAKAVAGEVEKKEAPVATGEEATKSRVRKLEPDRTYTDRFRMNPLRTWMPVIMLSPILIVFFFIRAKVPAEMFPPLFSIILTTGLFFAISLAIKTACTRFGVKTDTVEFNFDFLIKKSLEFSLDKVTGVIFKENILDKLCGTCSIVFCSIGSGEHLKFLNIKKTKDLRGKILAKKGFHTKNVLYRISSKYDLLGMIKGNLYGFVFLAFLVIPGIVFFSSYMWLPLACLAALMVFIYIYRAIYFAQSKMVFYEDYVHFKRGLFAEEDYFASHDDIKDITTVKFPLSDKGNLTFNVAGELVTKTRQGKRIVSNAFTIRFVDEINSLDELIDRIFYDRPSPEIMERMAKHHEDTSDKPDHISRQCLSNVLVFVLPVLAGAGAFAAVVLFSMTMKVHTIAMVLLPIGILILAAVIIPIKAISYNVQSYRLYERSGVIFKKQTSIIFGKMDFINFTQGPVNKIFGNGNITVNTTGSSKPEMVIRNIRDFRQFYEMLKTKYK